MSAASEEVISTIFISGMSRPEEKPEVPFFFRKMTVGQSANERPMENHSPMLIAVSTLSPVRTQVRMPASRNALREGEDDGLRQPPFFAHSNP